MQSSRCGYSLVVVLGFLISLGGTSARADDGALHQAWQTRPIQLGTSGGNINDRSRLYCCSGTLGSLVTDADGNLFILSNNHVLALVNEASIGDDINQPGQIDQSCGQDGIVADLSDYVAIKFKQGNRAPLNEVDAAIAQVRPDDVAEDGAILDIGPLSGNTAAPFVGLEVQKSGRTTGLTRGVITSVAVTVDVGYGKECGKSATETARFVNQILLSGDGSNAGHLSAGGDSGSLFVTSDGQNDAVALLFAGSSASDVTIASPIDTVLSLLGVSMVGATLAPATTGTVAGTVINQADGTAVEGAAVRTDTGESTTTDASGSYTIADVPTGERSVTASAAGFDEQSQPATVTENETTLVDFALSPSPTASTATVDCITYTTEGGRFAGKHLLITVSLADDSGSAVAGASVSISATRDGNSIGSATGTTDSAGNVAFTVKNAPEGCYKTDVIAVTADGLTFDGSEPANGFQKGTDPTPDADCRDASTLCGAGGASVAATGPVARLRNAIQVKGRHEARLFQTDGVVGVGVSRGEDGAPLIEVYFESDLQRARARIPAHVENVPIRRVVTGSFNAF